MNTTLKNDPVLLILNAFYQSIGERNTETAASFFADNIDWYIPKSNVLPWTGKRTKKSEIINTLQLLFDAHVTGEDQIEIDPVFIDGNEAAVFGRASRMAKKTGKRFNTQFCQRFTFSDGKITKFLMLEDTPEIEKPFNLKSFLDISYLIREHCIRKFCTLNNENRRCYKIVNSIVFKQKNFVEYNLYTKFTGRKS